MDKKLAAKIIKGLVDIAVQRGLFKTTEDVIAIQNALDTLVTDPSNEGAIGTIKEIVNKVDNKEGQS